MVPKSKIPGNSKTYRWENTHKMLEYKQVSGIKTGITVNAGPCLATAIKLDEFEFIIVLLSCKSTDIRWVETWKLAKWAKSRLKKIKQF